MTHWTNGVMIVTMVAALAGGVHAETPADDGPRLQQLQKQVDALQESVDTLRLSAEKEEPVRTFSAKSFRLGGWATQAFTSIQASGSDRYSFNHSEVSLLASVDVTDRTHFFGNLLFNRTAEDPLIHTPDRRFDNYENNVEVEIAQVSHEFSDRFGLRAGQIIAPFGIMNVQHFDPALLQQGLPQFLRDPAGKPFAMIDDVVQGADAYGNYVSAGGHRIDAEAYVCSLQSDLNKLGGGGRQSWTSPGGHVGVGTSQQAGSLEGKSFLTLGQDIKIEHKRFLLQSEAAQTLITGDNLYAFYVQPSYRLTEKWIVFLETDYLDNPLNITAGALDPFRQYEHTLGINFLPSKNLRLRGELTGHHYLGESGDFEGRNRDYLSIQTSFTVSF